MTHDEERIKLTKKDTDISITRKGYFKDYYNYIPYFPKFKLSKSNIKLLE
jgi:uncharacterized protein (DUF927 family)